MKASVYSRYGPPEILRIMGVENPTPKDDEILVKVHRTTVNRTDCGMRMAKPFIVRFFTGLFRPKTPISGTDFAGIVEAVGKNVTEYKKGDKVFGFNDESMQSHAEYLVADSKKMVGKIPSGISYDLAAASLEAAHYAYNFLSLVDIKKGQKVLVNGGTGAIGSASIQFLKFYGLQVTATCGTGYEKLMKSIGADRVIDYKKEDFTKLDEQFDFIFDSVGKSTFGKCKRIMKKDAVYMSSELGPFCQNVFLPLFTKIFGGKRVIFPIPVRRSIEFIQERLADGSFKPVIDRTYDFKDLVKAFNYVLTGEKIGNVVIRITK